VQKRNGLRTPLGKWILHQIKVGITKNQPFCAGGLEIDLNTSVCTLTLAVEDDTITEFSMAYPLTEPHAYFGSGAHIATATW